MAENMTDKQAFVVDIEPVDENGEPREVESVVFSLENSSGGAPAGVVLTTDAAVLESLGGGKAAAIPDDGFAGDFEIVCKLDALPGEGEKPLTDRIALHVSQSLAERIGLKGRIVPKPTVAPPVPS